MEPVWLEFRFQGSSSCPWLERNALDAWGCKLHAAVIGACVRGSQYSCRRLGLAFASLWAVTLILRVLGLLQVLEMLYPKPKLSIPNQARI